MIRSDSVAPSKDVQQSTVSLDDSGNLTNVNAWTIDFNDPEEGWDAMATYADGPQLGKIKNIVVNTTDGTFTGEFYHSDFNFEPGGPYPLDFNGTVSECGGIIIIDSPWSFTQPSE